MQPSPPPGAVPWTTFAFSSKSGTPQQSTAPQTCACGKPAAMSCARCHVARYCSPKCQEAAWPSHKVFCSPKPDRIIRELLWPHIAPRALAFRQVLIVLGQHQLLASNAQYNEVKAQWRKYGAVLQTSADGREEFELYLGQEKCSFSWSQTSKQKEPPPFELLHFTGCSTTPFYLLMLFLTGGRKCFHGEMLCGFLLINAELESNVGSNDRPTSPLFLTLEEGDSFCSYHVRPLSAILSQQVGCAAFILHLNVRNAKFKWPFPNSSMESTWASISSMYGVSDHKLVLFTTGQTGFLAQAFYGYYSVEQWLHFGQPLQRDPRLPAPIRADYLHTVLPTPEFRSDAFDLQRFARCIGTLTDSSCSSKERCDAHANITGIRYPPSLNPLFDLRYARVDLQHAFFM